MRHPLAPHRLAERMTLTDGAIVLCHLGVPRLDREAWSLAIDGLVGRPLRLRFAGIERRPRIAGSSGQARG
jgi:DMSO/TMAO reductase YedYZ molybdopterin-dependent catalytic subunit